MWLKETNHLILLKCFIKIIKHDELKYMLIIQNQIKGKHLLLQFVFSLRRKITQYL